MATKKTLSRKKQQALAEFRDNKLAAAKSLYLEICRDDGKDADAWHMLSAINGMMGLYKESEACARKVLELHPRFPGALKNLGSALLAQGLVAEAKDNYQRVLRITPDDAECYSNLGNAWSRERKFEQAVECCRRSIEIQPDYAEAHNNLGNALLGLCRSDEALASFQRALRIKTDYLDAFFNMGRALQELGRSEQALGCYQQVLQVKPGFANAQLGIADILHEQGRFDEAEKIYLNMLESNPGEARAGIGITSVLLRQHKYDQALQFARRNQEHNPDSADVQYSLGLAHNKTGNTGEAASCFREVLKLAPDHAQAHHSLAMLGEVPAPQRADASYVTSLFDGYANTFDQHLVECLKYGIPEGLRKSILDIGCLRRDMDVLDMGCGTGLCGPLFREYALSLVGVDLSPKMINKARERAVYDELVVGDLMVPLSRPGVAFDLVLAADVFVYIGDLEKVFEGVAAALKPGGVFGFSVEATDAQSYVLHSRGRYAHSLSYIRTLADSYGMDVLLAEDVVVRVNEGKPVDGHTVLLGSGKPHQA